MGSSKQESYRSAINFDHGEYIWVCGVQRISRDMSMTHEPQTFVKNSKSWKEWFIEVLEEECLPMNSVYGYVLFTVDQVPGEH